MLARSWLPTRPSLFDRVQLGAGMRCLDLGCGSGDVTFEWPRRVGPDGSVTGVDMDKVKLDWPGRPPRTRPRQRRVPRG